jgi:hypothetical protein
LGGEADLEIGESGVNKYRFALVGEGDLEIGEPGVNKSLPKKGMLYVE